MVSDSREFPNVAIEAYAQSLFTDIAQELLYERSRRISAEDAMEQTVDEASVTIRALYKHQARINELEREVKHDTLTDLLEKTAWINEVENMINRDNHFGIIYIDLTNFKWVNDTISHHEGDRILIDFADMIRAVTRATQPDDKDLVSFDEAPANLEADIWAGRLGGDEFALLLDLTPRKDFTLSDEERLNKVIDRLTQSCNIFLDNEPELRAGGFNFAIGGTVRTSEDTSITVVTRAERNMYRAKRKQHASTGANR